MSRIVIVGSEEFELPDQGANPDYGEELTDFFVAISEALETIQQPNDILRTTAVISNNISSPTAISGFSFNTAEVRSINAEFYIKRTTDAPANNLTESGFIEGNYTGSDWTIAIRSEGNAGVTLDITAGGQITYTSTNVSGSNYSGIIVFKAKVINEDE